MSSTAQDKGAAAKPVAAVEGAGGKKAPLASIFIVMTEAHPGQEDEFNDWYTNIHCHDTMRISGSVAVQRWKLSPYQLRYNAAYVGPRQRWLCIYEMQDTQANIDAHLKDVFTDAMPITSAQDISNAEDFYYQPVEAGKNAVEVFASRASHVITVRMNALAGKDAAFIKWYKDEYLPRTLKLFGFEAGDLYRATDIQLIGAPPVHRYQAVYHVADPMVAIESLDSHLAQSGTLIDCPLVDKSSIRIACYSPITNRLTAQHVLNLPPEQRALEDKFRANMGNRRHMGEAPGGLKIKRD